MLPLKEATAEKHKIAERKPFNIRMFRGQLDKPAYLLYLVQQLEIFSAIEENPLPHPALRRTSAVMSDISELQHEGYPLPTVLEATSAYANYLRSLGEVEILPHVYLNYLAIMFGGQMMKAKVPSTGKMYDFSDMQGALAAVRAVQKDEWAGEVNKGFDYNIAIFDALENSITGPETAIS